jgi:uncharacterized membrane protein
MEGRRQYARVCGYAPDVDRGDWVKVVLVLHVLGAILGLGTNLTYGLIAAVGDRAGGASRTFSLRLIEQLDRRLANPAYVAQLLTGLLLVWLLELNLFETSWLLLALALYLGVALTGILVYGPALRRQVELAERLEVAGPGDGDPALAASYAGAARRSNVLGIAVTLAVVLIVVLMVAKPALW